jgi:predicted DNA-binding protein (MmcQ/YjbR family)
MDPVTRNSSRIDPVERLRRICLALPETNERLSHGEPSFFVRDKKQFVSVDNHHHGADHLAFWCPAVPGAQEQLIAEDSAQFFRPPYVGHRGWVGVRIDGKPDWDEIAAIVADAYRLIAPKRLSAQLDEPAT